MKRNVARGVCACVEMSVKNRKRVVGEYERDRPEKTKQ